MKHLSIDIETYSDVDIAKSGLYKYVQSPEFRILLISYSFLDENEVYTIDCTQEGYFKRKEYLDFIEYLKDPLIIKHAYNATFEWYCLNKACYSPLPLEHWCCTMFHALYAGFPASLEAAGEAMGLPADKKKMAAGKALIRTFCNPCKPSKSNGNRTRTLPQHEPEKWRLFVDYNRQDVVTEKEIQKRLLAVPIPNREQYLWYLDQKINLRGIEIDKQLVNNAIAINEQITQELMQEAISVSGIDNPNSIKQLTEWLQNELNQEITSLTKENVKDLLAGDISDKAKRMLEIRQELAKTSVKKYQAMIDCIGSDNRARGFLQIYGANRTGRWAGRLVQVQNLPRNNLETLDHARQSVKNNKIDALKIIYGNVSDTLSQLIRTAFIPKKDHVFIVADFAAIEARIIAWLAGEKWRQEVFASHGKIYEASASAMFSVPIEQITKDHPLRQKGKVAELALGYQGSTGALIAMGALNMGLTEAELPEIVARWRQANPRIVDLWYSVENAALQALQNGISGIKGIVFAVEKAEELSFLTILLPSGRKLYYCNPFVIKNDLGREALHYYGVDQSSKWKPISTYGGKLVENITQAIARDCLAEAIIRLEAAGYSIVMHVHDEVIIETPAENAEQKLEYVCELMGQPIDWAPGLLLKADGFISNYYKKE